MQNDAQLVLAQELGIAELPPLEQEQIIAGFSEVALKSATAAVLEKLSEEKRMEFAALAEAGDPVPFAEFLNREVPGHEALAGAAVAEEAKRFKESLAA